MYTSKSFSFYIISSQCAITNLDNLLFSLLRASGLSILTPGDSFFDLKRLGEIRRNLDVILLSFATVDFGTRLDVETLSNLFSLVKSSLATPIADRFGLDAN